jgi:hypothetical protein
MTGTNSMRRHERPALRVSSLKQVAEARQQIAERVLFAAAAMRM